MTTLAACTFPRTPNRPEAVYGPPQWSDSGNQEDPQSDDDEPFFDEPIDDVYGPPVLFDDDDDDSINGGNYYQDNEDYEGQGVDGQKRLRDMQDLEPSQVQRLNEMDDDFLAAKKILSDVPARSLKPAENYVASMVQGERPADTLASLTPVEGVNQVEFTPAESMGILDIHDSKNEPIVADLEDGLDPEQKQNLAADYMNAAINSLPDDRKAIVSELKNAVENWANANGQDPKAAFAEKLRDLAAGWDDESLNAVAQTYVDADREIAASTAG
jgi:hypothetical protein